MAEPCFVVRIYEPEDARMWMAELHNSVGKHLATVMAPRPGMVWAMLQVALDVDDDVEEGA